MSGLAAGDLRDFIRFERLVRPTGRGKAGQETWEAVATIRAEVLDKLPSRSETLAEGMVTAARSARVRIRPRSGINSDMRIAIGALDQPDDPRPAGRRYLSIIGGPARVREPECIELTVQELSTAGSGA